MKVFDHAERIHDVLEAVAPHIHALERKAHDQLGEAVGQLLTYAEQLERDLAEQQADRRAGVLVPRKVAEDALTAFGVIDDFEVHIRGAERLKSSAGTLERALRRQAEAVVKL